MYKHFRLLCIILPALFLFPLLADAQLGQTKKTFTRQDTLRGSNGPGRVWWDIQHYAIEVTPDLTAKTISGKVTIRFKQVQSPGEYMQIDLQEPMILDKAVYNGKPLTFTRNQNVYLL